MPRLSHKYPSYRRHAPSKQAVVTLGGKDHYLGTYGTKASRDEYDRLIGEWLASGRQRPAHRDEAGELCVSELINAFRKHAERYYRKADGTPTGECAVFRHALRPLRRLYGRTAVGSFGPLALKALGEEMIRLGWCRGTINRQFGRVKHVFKWGTANELVPAGVYHALQAVGGLKAGRSAARESEPVRPVPEAHVDAVLPRVSPQIAAMIRLQMFTGMRPGEVCAMRTCDIDTSGNLWAYRPAGHKTAHHGHARVIFLGPQAQDVVGPFLKADLQAFLFVPAEAERWRRAEAAARRATPEGRGNVPGSNRVRAPKRKAGARYNVAAYRRAIARACDTAFPPPSELAGADPRDPRIVAWRAAHRWHPHQLRHNAATAYRKKYGIEVAQVILGHRTLSVTEVYAERDVAKAMQVMADVG